MTVDQQIFQQAHSFLTNAFVELNDKKLIIDEHWHIDHLCFRTSTEEKYLYTKNQFKTFSLLLIESEVNGRLISTFKLHNSIKFQDWEIDLIEVPAPKKGKKTIDGFEHFEIVCDLTFDEIKNRYIEHEFDDSGLTKELNKEFEINFSNFAVKFHQMSLESVINIENNQLVMNALRKSEILKKLSSFNPLLAGTFPLNINIKNSDLDILVSGNLELIESIMTEVYSGFANYQCTEQIIQGLPTIIINFLFEGVNFEIFAQNIPSVKQIAYLHYLAEERILKIGKDNLKKKIIEIRNQGLKTELAFAKELKLTGDPYEAILNLQKMANSDLKNLIQKTL